MSEFYKRKDGLIEVLEEHEEAHALAREMYDKELLLLGRLKAYRDRLEIIRELAKNPTARSNKLAALIRIYAIAEEALAL